MCDELLEANREGVMKVYGITEQDMDEYFNHIKEWYLKQPHLPEVHFEKPEARKVIETMLARNKFSLEKMKQGIETYFTLKNLITEPFTDADILNPAIQTALNTCPWIPLRKLTPNLECVSIATLLDPNIDNYQPWDLIKASMLMGELRLKYEFSLGDQLIYDFNGYTMAHMLKVTPPVIKKCFLVFKFGSRLKINGVHILNAPPSFNTILMVFKAIMKPKIYERIHIHENLESLHKFIPKEILPVEYGGDEPSIRETLEIWKKHLKLNREYLLRRISLKVDESKRIGKFNTDDFFGSMHGSFRQLQVD